MHRRYICVALALMILLAAVSCRTSAGRSPSQVMSDSGITTELKTKFLAEGIMKGLSVSVKTFDGIVTLTGAVKTQVQKDKATQLAHTVNGVKQVNNELMIRQ